jgi:hypothetical protein
MPRSFRWKIKRDFEQVVKNLEKAGLKLHELEELYRPSQPATADLLQASQIYLYQIAQALEEIEDQI